MSSLDTWRRRFMPFAVAVLGTVISVSVYLGLRVAENEDIEQEFLRRTQSLTSNLDQNLRSSVETLRSLRDLYHYSEDVTRLEFTLAAADLMARKPAVVSLLWAPRLTPAKRSAFEAEARGALQSDFRIFPTTSDAERDAFPVYYISPYGAAPLEGYDLASSNTWGLFGASTADGEPRGIGHPAFLPSDTPSAITLIILPVYHDSVPRSVPEREKMLRGFLLAFLDTAVLLERSANQMQDSGLFAVLQELSSSHESRVLHSLGERPDNDLSSVHTLADPAGLHAEREVTGSGVNWVLSCRPGISWLSHQKTHRAAITGGLCFLFFSVLAFYLQALSRQTAAVEAMVTERTMALTATQKELELDIRRRIATEAALKTSEERYRTFVSQSADFIWRLELPAPLPLNMEPERQVAEILAHARIAECNEPAARAYNHRRAADIVGYDLLRFAPDSKSRHQVVITAFVRNQPRLTDFELSEGDGADRIFLHNLFAVDEDGFLKGIWMIERELTAQRRMEQERQRFEKRLAETQRLESLGVLAGGIAHDFNNLLTGVLGHASLGRTELPPDSPINDHFEQIESASRSAASLCQQMLAYAGKGRFVLRPENLSSIVSNTTHLLQASISKQAELHLDLAPNLPCALFDATQVQQIIMNLVINASEALGPNPGRITVATGLILTQDDTFRDCALVPEERVGKYIFIDVIDSGPGMTPEILSRIFEPFFTTKFAGRGLGLAATLGIVRRHNGALRVTSSHGAGTTFRLYLPVSENSVEVAPTENDSHSPWNAQGTILVIDDEAPVRSIAERIGRSLGFEVVSAENGAAGLSLLEKHKKDVSVVLLDMSMPGLSGKELLAKFREQVDLSRIVVMSGYNQSTFTEEGEESPLFLPKPFGIAQFEHAMKQVSRRFAQLTAK